MAAQLTPLRQALYQQVFTLIRTRIVEGELPPGACLPNEFELANAYHVSIGTIRKAVDLLVEARFLHRQQGRGTFVSAERWSPVDRICDLLRDSQGQEFQDWRAEELSYASREPDPEIAAALELRPGEQAHHIVSVYRAQSDVAVYEDSWLSCSLFPDVLSPPEREDRSSVMRRQGVLVDHVRRQVRLAPADDNVSRALSIQPGTPVLVVTRALMTEEKRPVEVARAHCLTGAGWIEVD